MRGCQTKRMSLHETCTIPSQNLVKSKIICLAYILEYIAIDVLVIFQSQQLIFSSPVSFKIKSTSLSRILGSPFPFTNTQLVPVHHLSLSQ